jgi:ankyrin repeat protein
MRDRLIDAIRRDDVIVFSAIPDDDLSAIIDNDDTYTLLHWCAQEGASACADFLIANRAKVDVLESQGASPALVAAAYGNADVLERLLLAGAKCLTDRKGYSILHAAAASGSLRTVHSAYQAVPALVNSQDDGGTGRTPLHWACQQGHDDVVEFLLERGAIPDGVSHGEFTPLRIAAAEGHTSIVTRLLRAGATAAPLNIGEQVTAPSPLHDAVAWERLDVIQCLLDSGAEVNSRDQDGRTPLHYAVQCGNVSIVNTLLDHGAVSTQEDETGVSPIGLAATLGESSIIRALSARGGTSSQ